MSRLNIELINQIEYGVQNPRINLEITHFLMLIINVHNLRKKVVNFQN